MSFSYPVFLSVEGRSAVVVGGGRAGSEKSRGLVAAGARVTVIAEEPSRGIEHLAKEQSLTLLRRRYLDGDLAGAFIAIAATGVEDVDAQVMNEARERKVLALVASDPSAGDFITPATVRRGDLVMAVSTGGRAPSVAKHLRVWLEREFGPEWESVIDMAASARAAVPRGLEDHERTRRWRAALSPELLGLIREGRIAEASDRVGRVVSGRALLGFVSLVGAGPGDPGLLTLKGKERLASADAVVYDRLACPDLLDLAPVDAERLYIGRAYGRHTLEQEELNNLLIFLAGQGKRVVRLKGGDPFVFGRGGEEATALARAGVPFEIVPGVTSAVAVPAYAGIPVTDRRFGSSVAFVTGHKDPDDPENRIDWSGLATSVETLIVLMGARRPAEIAQALIRSGRPPDTPAAAIEWGTYPSQRTVVGALADLPTTIAETGLGSPMILVVGEVVSLRESLGWFEQKLPDAVLAEVSEESLLEERSGR